jgi:hypothetical protein
MRIFGLAAAALSLAACTPKGPPANPNEAIVGAWGDAGTHCAVPLTYNADGTFEYTGRAGRWTLEGDHLTLSGAGGDVPAQVQWIDRDHMRLTRPDGSPGISERCPK